MEKSFFWIFVSCSLLHTDKSRNLKNANSLRSLMFALSWCWAGTSWCGPCLTGTYSNESGTDTVPTYCLPPTPPLLYRSCSRTFSTHLNLSLTQHLWLRCVILKQSITFCCLVISFISLATSLPPSLPPFLYPTYLKCSLFALKRNLSLKLITCLYWKSLKANLCVYVCVRAHSFYLFL